MATNLVSTSKARMNLHSSPLGMRWEGQAEDAIPEVSWASPCEGSREDVADEERQFLTVLSTAKKPRPNSDGKTQQHLALSLSCDGQISYFKWKAEMGADN